MSLHSYSCSSCGETADLNIEAVETDVKGYVNHKLGYSCSYSFLVSSLSEKEIKRLKDWEDPRDFEKYETIYFTLDGDIPLKVPCIFCEDGVLEKKIPNINGWTKGNCFTNRERERQFYQHGLNKKEAERFYKESIEASKERMSTMGDVYKRVDPDIDHLRKTGQIKKINDKKKAEKIENLKKINIELQKPLKKKK